MIRLLMFGGLAALMLNGSVYADYTQRADVRAYVAELVAEHGFAADELDELFARAQRKQSILDAIARPAERTLKWHEYRDIFIEEPRIDQGLEFWAAHEDVLLEAVEELEPDLVVLGTSSRRGIAGFLMGNTAERLLDRIPASILGVKPGDRGTEE